MTQLALLLRADASHVLGAGHVMRLIALADAARAAGVAARFIVGGDPAPMLAVLAARGHAAAPAGGALTEDLAAHAAALAPARVAIVLDGRFDPAAVTALVARGLAVAALDDQALAPLPATLIVNPALGAETLADRYPHATVRLLGRAYALLRQDVLAQPRLAPTTARRRVLVTFGGSDPLGATPRMLTALVAAQAAVARAAPLAIDVVIGAQFAHRDPLQHAVALARAAGHAVDLRVQVADLPALMAGVDVAISGAGGTLAELAYLGRPTAAYAIAPDQIEVARAHAATGRVHGGLDLTVADDTALAASLAEFLADDAGRLARAARAADDVDGAGAARVLRGLDALAPG
ncbi:MAG: hypothetical protein K8W52_36960 [Deltaproteobacteria bacterium]|nr:hypothetical protein [Deltaproteobacteria bacterium]